MRERTSQFPQVRSNHGHSDRGSCLDHGDQSAHSRRQMEERAPPPPDSIAASGRGLVSAADILSPATKRRRERELATGSFESVVEEVTQRAKYIDALVNYALGGQLDVTAGDLEWPDEPFAVLESDRGRVEATTWARVFRRAFSSLNVVVASNPNDLGPSDWRDIAEGVDIALNGLETRLAAIAQNRVFDE